MSFSVFEKIDPSCQNGSMEKAKNLPYHQRPYASIAERTLVDISIYSPRPQIAGTGHSHSKISIHSPRAGRDCRYPNAPLITQISIHSPRMGRDRLVNAPIVSPSLFQSTLPAWGETIGLRQRHGHYSISIHSPRMGRDLMSVRRASISTDFNPLSPHGERPADSFKTFNMGHISIHSPRMGRDRSSAGAGPPCSDFNPLSPHGERLKVSDPSTFP